MSTDDSLTSNVMALPAAVATGEMYVSIEWLMDGDDVIDSLKSVLVSGNEEFQIKGKIRFVNGDSQSVRDDLVDSQVKSVNITHANLVAAGEYYDPTITWPTSVIADRNKVIARALFTKMSKAKTQDNVNVIASESRAAWIDTQMVPWEGE